MARSACSSSRTSSRNLVSLAYGPVFGRTGGGGFGLGEKVVRATGAATAPLADAAALDAAAAVPAFLAAGLSADFFAAAGAALAFFVGPTFLAAGPDLRAAGAALFVVTDFLAGAGAAFLGATPTAFFADD